MLATKSDKAVIVHDGLIAGRGKAPGFKICLKDVAWTFDLAVDPVFNE